MLKSGVELRHTGSVSSWSKCFLFSKATDSDSRTIFSELSRLIFDRGKTGDASKRNSVDHDH